MIITIFRSSIRTRVVINHAHTQILSRTPRGLQNAVEGQGMDLGAARGLVSPSLKVHVNLLVVYYLARGGSS